jgi:hypothetical protein
MAASFELIDYDSGNLVGSYATLDEAVTIARAAYERYGMDGLRGLALLRVEDGNQVLVAEDLESCGERPPRQSPTRV